MGSQALCYKTQDVKQRVENLYSKHHCNFRARCLDCAFGTKYKEQRYTRHIFATPDFKRRQKVKRKKNWSARFLCIFLFSSLMDFHWKYFLSLHRLSFGSHNLQPGCSEISALVPHLEYQIFFEDDLNVCDIFFQM